MGFLRRFARFWYDFVVGDDWRLAVGAVVLVTAVYVLAHHGVNAWWLLPIGVAAILGVSLGVAARRARRSVTA
jgi:succinate dehydrogenase/fumarate reductase cytochrome b subunit